MIFDHRIPIPTYGFDPKTDPPQTWSMRLSKARRAVLLPELGQ
ncbi:MAG: hypothetical protein ABGX16_04900 [Pirellulales bacterium]